MMIKNLRKDAEGKDEGDERGTEQGRSPGAGDGRKGSRAAAGMAAEKSPELPVCEQPGIPGRSRRRHKDRKRLYASLLSCILWVSVLDFLVKILTGFVTTMAYWTGTAISGLAVWSLLLTLWNVVVQSMTPLYVAFAALAADRLIRVLSRSVEEKEETE